MKEEKEMKQYTITLSEKQMLLIAHCLEDLSRFASGQMRLTNTLNAITGIDLEIEKKAEEKLNELRDILFPNMHSNTSLGYNETPFIGNTYQIYRSIYHRLAIDNDWNNVYSSEALPSGTMGRVTIKTI